MPPIEDALVRVPADLLAKAEAILQARGGLPFAVALPPADSDDDLLATAAMRQATLDSFYDDRSVL
jgi:hypothetical protein